MSASVDVAIVGGGMVGLALAQALRAAEPGLRLAVIDAGRPPHFDRNDDVGLRVSAISPGSAELLRRCGAWEHIAGTRASPYQRMRVWDAEGDPQAAGALDFSAEELGIAELGHIVENELIRASLYRTLEDAEGTFHFGSRLMGLDVDGHAATLTLDGGRSLSCRLVVGADGARSAVRELSGLEVRGWRYPQDALVTHVRPERPHQSTAWQRFLAGGPIALLPLADGRCSVVWSAATAECAELAAADDASLAARLTEATDGVLGRLEIAGPRGSFPLRAAYAPSYVGRRVVLVGDAAHAVHPLAGQGVNLGFGDARELAERVVTACRRGEDPGDRPVLRRYERARKGENMRTLVFLDGLQRLFGVDSPVAARVRIGGMTMFNRIGPLKRMAVRHATGLGENAG